MMEPSLEMASVDFSAEEVRGPPRKRQKVASTSPNPGSQTPHDAALSKTMAHNVWMDNPAFNAQLDREARSGILCFVNPSNTGFTGVLKQRSVCVHVTTDKELTLRYRYTDFLVNEVDLEGNVVHLTGINIPRQKSLNKVPFGIS
jgi:tRNA pseudouridine13 synthase